MTTTTRQNEKSWRIDLISQINSFVDSNDLTIKRAGGETTILNGRGNTMFPDVILYGDKEQSVFLQGWELKMPDTPIEDEMFIKDAQRKAQALNLNSCLIWNFTYVALYERAEGDNFARVKQWNSTNHIRTREDVETYRSDWEQLLEEVVLEVNEYFISGQFRDTSIDRVISESAITMLIQRNKHLIADELKANAFRNSVIDAFIDNWWLDISSEYVKDETDKYEAYAKTVVLNWALRIIFAHLIKRRQNGALLVEEIDYGTTPNEANAIFEQITKKCDFYNVFSPTEYDEFLPELSWQDFIELSVFLQSNGIDHLSQKALQNILEGSVSRSKRAINGQYTTPPELAKLLLRLTIRDWSDSILDCCCGTGTIPNEALKFKKTQMEAIEAVESVWACDKNKFPLQVANVAMTSIDSINLANRLFQHNALTLTVGEEITLTDPATGEQIVLHMPRFGAIVSNLPFVENKHISNEDKDEIAKDPKFASLDKRTDLYCYIAIKVSEVIKPNGRLGVIISNSWLGTNVGQKFVETLEQVYDIQQIHLSGKGRWFENADIVTTLLVLEKKSGPKNQELNFWLWKKSLEELANDKDAERSLINAALLSTEKDRNISVLSKYTRAQVDDLLNLNVSYNALFHDVNWLLEIDKNNILPICEVYDVVRGSRRGWDALFYPQNGKHNIEPQYLKKVLHNARDVDSIITTADSDAFCCALTTEELKKKGHTGALNWIDKFSEQTNNVGRPLPEVLKRSGMKWYELQDNEIVDVFTMMNPDERFFFGKFKTPSFINQRLIGLKRKDNFPDDELNHALLNSIFTTFYIEAVGFGRGLGVLDINKEKIANSYMLNPNCVSSEARQKILSAFEKVKARAIMKISEELDNPDRLNFEHEVLKSFEMDAFFERIKNSLLSMQNTRRSAKND